MSQNAVELTIGLVKTVISGITQGMYEGHQRSDFVSGDMIRIRWVEIRSICARNVNGCVYGLGRKSTENRP
jgi:hypothetical protein